MANLDTIPFPQYTSWMHQRIPLPHEPLSEIQARYNQIVGINRFAQGLGSRAFRWVYHYVKMKGIWVIYRLVMGFEWLWYRIYNHIEVHGRENIPKSGAILIMNHIGSKDVEIIMSMFKRPISVFTDIGDGWFADIMEKVFSFVPRLGLSDVMIEKMIRIFLLKNRFMAMWPEGSPSSQLLPERGDPAITEGFSGIVKVYAAINAFRDRLPFVPIMMRGAECYWSWHHKTKRPKKSTKIILDIYKPIFIPRTWLKRPEEGGKSPREIVNLLMMFLARKKGQKELYKNWALERRRQSTERNWH
jgi:1-acyl-sn-glycerol-3-phosphate acyltransferase